MDQKAVVDQIQTDVEALAALAGRLELDTPVPTCAPWTLGDLVAHLGSIVTVFGAHLADERSDRRISRRSGPEPPAGDPRPWFRRQAEATLAELAVADLERPSPTFLGRRTNAWWARRAMIELTMHRLDVELAAGVTPFPTPPDVGVVGIGEMTEFVVAYGNVLSDQMADHTVHLHALEPDGGEWFLTLGRPVTVSSTPSAADVTVRGEAGALLRLLWNRPPGGPIEMVGKDTVLIDLLSIFRI